MEKSIVKTKNVLFIVLDSCRYDTAKNAYIPTMCSLGPLRKACTHGSYTIPAHLAFFSGHLPVVLRKPFLAYYSESKKQLWRIKIGPTRDTRESGILLRGNNVLEGYEKMGFFILGVGGVTQFSNGSLLRKYFKNFIYYGQNLDEEPLKPRKKELFPLNHIDKIVAKIKGHDKWFLFINCPETHYPYDYGNGISNDVAIGFDKIKDCLNLRECINKNIDNKLFAKLKLMQINAVEKIDKKIKSLVDKLPKHRDILVVICGDHGENFGEYFEGKRRWGHLFPSTQVMNVPLIIGQISKNYGSQNK